MDETLAPTRCRGCGRGINFDDWARGIERCRACLKLPLSQAEPAATFTRGPARSPAPRGEEERYLQMLDTLPDALVDELVAALEAEAALLPAKNAQPAARRAAAMQEALAELGGRSPREVAWAAWGFAGGFALNVLVAKYAQMESSAPLSAFVAPLFLGGLLAGAACAAIGWGLARLRG